MRSEGKVRQTVFHGFWGEKKRGKKKFFFSAVVKTPSDNGALKSVRIREQLRNCLMNNEPPKMTKDKFLLSVSFFKYRLPAH